MRKTEKEISEIKRQNIFIVENLLLEKEHSNDDISRQFSGIMHLNNMTTFAWDWLPEELTNRYEVDVEEEKKWTLEKFAEKHVHPISIQELGPIYFQALNSKTTNSVEAFEYVKLNEQTEYEWVHKTSIFSFRLGKIVSISHFLRGLEKEINQEEKILNEYDFIRTNFSKFMLLTTQQKRVLKLLAIGHTNQMIASELQISPNTVRSHRNQIHKALDLRWKNINHIQTYMQYAFHFGLL